MWRLHQHLKTWNFWREDDYVENMMKTGQHLKYAEIDDSRENENSTACKRFHHYFNRPIIKLHETFETSSGRDLWT